MTDQELVREIKYGNVISSDKALRQIYKSCYDMTVKMILNNNGTTEDAKDVFQNSIIVLYYKIKKEDFILSSKISTLLYSISRNLWLKHIRDNKKSANNLELTNLQIEGSDDIHLALEFSEKQKFLGDLLLKSGEKCLALLKAYYYEKLRMKKIAELQNYSSEQVAKNQKVRCLKKIRSIMSDKNEYQEFSDL